MLKMNSAIILGGAGFIGSALARNLNNRGINVCVVDKKSALNSLSLSGEKIELIDCSLENIEALPHLLSRGSYDVFYQFAWDGLEYPELVDYEVQLNNVYLTMNAIKVAKILNCVKFIGAGSFTQQELLIKSGRHYQEDKHRYYRVAEFMCDTLGRGVAYENGIDFFWPQITNVYGPGERSKRLINSLIRNIKNGAEMPLSEGNQLYDFIYIDDAAEAFFCIGENGCPGDEYIVGSGNPMPLNHYLKIVRDIISPEYKLLLGKLHYSGLYPSEEIFDITSLRRIGFSARVSFEEGIRRTGNWIDGANIDEYK